MIYLDNAATTYPKSESVYKALDYANREYAFNAGRGSYEKARIATEIIDTTKKQIKELCHAAENSSVIFTPSITIAINQILQGIDFRNGDNIYYSPYEHNAVARTLHLIQKTDEVAQVAWMNREQIKELFEQEVFVGTLEYFFTEVDKERR